MIQKKVCMLGAFAVGKTSLVARYVRSIFTDKYHSTVGVKIDKKTVQLEDRTVNLLLWDLYGEDQFQQIQMSYLRGSSGYLLVADGMRPETFKAAFGLHERVTGELGNIPFLLLINKADLKPQWRLAQADIDKAQDEGWKVLETSAKTGEGVEKAFELLASRIS